MNFSQTGKTCEISTQIQNKHDQGFPGHAVDMGLTPGPGRFHTLWIN